MNRDLGSSTITSRWLKPALSTLFALLSLVVCIEAQTQDVVWQQAATGGNAVTFSADGLNVLAGNQLRRASDGTLIQTFNNRRSGIISVALSPDGQYAAIGTQTNVLNLNFFRVSDGLRTIPTDAHNNGTTTLKFSPDGQLLASGGRDGTVKVWHVPELTLLHTFLGGPGYNARVFSVAFSPDGQFLAVGGQGGAQIIRIADGAIVQDLTETGTVQAVAFSPDGGTLAGAFFTTPYALQFWRVADGMLLNTIQASNQPLNAVAYQPDGQVIAVGGGDDTFAGIIRFFRVSDSSFLGFFPQDPNNLSSYVTSISYSPDGQLVAYSRADQLAVVARNPFICRMGISAAEADFSSKGGEGSVDVSACGGAWSVTSSADWLRIVGNKEGSGDATIQYFVEPNKAMKRRTGKLWINNQALTVVQEGVLFRIVVMTPLSRQLETKTGGGLLNARSPGLRGEQ